VFGSDLGAFIHASPGLEKLGVYNRRLPLKAALPALVYRITESGQRRFQSGPAGPLRIQAQLAVAATSPTAVEIAIETIVGALDGYRGPFGHSVSKGAFVRRLVDDAEPDAGTYWATAVLTIWLDNGGAEWTS